MPPPARFRVLQINDVYKIEGLEAGQSGGLARLRTLRQQLESDGTAVLILHGGDVLYPSVMSKYLEAKPMIDVMNLLDGDPAAFDPALIVTFGNHEFDNRDPNVLLQRLRQSQFPWISTNALHCAPACETRFPGVAETLIREIDGVRVGFLGLMYATKKDYVETTNVQDAARAGVANLQRDGARVIIALTHQDMSDDVALLRDNPGIDLVIGGHDHVFMQEQVQGRWATKADADAKSVVVYDVVVPRSGRPRTVPLRVVIDETIPKDPEVDGRVQEWLGRLSEALGGNETIGTTENLLEGLEPVVRGRETALGNLLADAARARMQSDVALINGGGIRINDNIPPGPITRYDMEGIFFYTNKLVTTRLSGAQLLEMLRNSVARADAADGRFLQVSGLKFTYRARGDQFTVDPADVIVGGKPLDLAATYTVTLADYLYRNGPEDGYELFSDANRPPKVSTDDPDFRTVVEEYIRERGTIGTKVEGRIVRR